MPNNQKNSSALPNAWIDWIFEEMVGMYGKRFVDMWGTTDQEAVREVWARRLAGLSGAQIARGMKLCERRPFPPTLPEFNNLCLGVDYEGAFREAVRQQAARQEGADKWPSRALYWAVQKFGPHELMSQPYGPVAKRWAAILDEQMAIEQSLPPIPEFHVALPSPDEVTIPKEELKRRLDALVAKMACGTS